MKRRRAVAVLVKDNRILLMYRQVNGKEYFVFPGGGVEEGETIEEAVRREVFEETSLIINIERFLYRLNDENTEHYFYLCSYISGEPSLGNGNEREEITESNQYRPEWHLISDLSTALIYPLEIRDLLISDLQAGFVDKHDELNLLVSERRKS